MQNQFKIFEYQSIEVAVPQNNTSGVYKFPDQRQLTDSPGRTIIIEGIEVFSCDGLGCSPVTGNELVSDIVMQNSFLTIKQGGNLTLQDMPLAKLINLANINSPYGNTGVIQLPLLRKLRNITWSQCQINFRGSSGDLPTANQIFAFGIYYTVLEDETTMTLQQNNY